jgi:hypothetical protein
MNESLNMKKTCVSTLLANKTIIIYSKKVRFMEKFFITEILHY